MNACRCHYRRLRLPAAYPIIDVSEVRVDGNPLPPADYRLDGHRDLVLQTPNSLGLNFWPRQNENALDDTVGTWAVDYCFGEEPTGMAKLANADLACALLQACPNSNVGGECPIPDSAGTVTKQGITIRFKPLDPTHTGVRSVDLLIMAYDCGKPVARLIDPADPLHVIRS